MANKQENKVKIIRVKEDLSPDDFEYDYNLELTAELDANLDNIDRNIINKIVLWKVNRYPDIKEETIIELNAIKGDSDYEQKHRDLLFKLLECKGVNLPMASTFLRFRNPKLFQIIDQHVYRLLTGEQLKLPIRNSEKNKQIICNMYFDYLTKLKGKCKELDIPFEKADRILFKADKRINKNVKLKNYGSAMTDNNEIDWGKPVGKEYW